MGQKAERLTFQSWWKSRSLAEAYSLIVQVLAGLISLIAAIVNSIIGPIEPGVWLFSAALLLFLPPITFGLFYGAEHHLKRGFDPDQLDSANAWLFRQSFGPEWKDKLQKRFARQNEWGVLFQRIFFPLFSTILLGGAVITLFAACLGKLVIN